MRTIFHEIAELNGLISICNYSYYDTSISLIPNAEYDARKKELQENVEQASRIDDLSSDESLILNVAKELLANVNHGKIDSRIKLRHLRPMLSLGNIFDVQELKAFNDRIDGWIEKAERSEGEQGAYNHFEDINRMDNHGDDIRKDDIAKYSAELKIDGVSFSALYKNGCLIRGLSRGDGHYGEDITENIKHLIDLPLSIKYKGCLEIRGEIYIANDDFDKLNHEMKQKNERIFANARNAVSGAMRLLDSNLLRQRKLRYFAWDCFIYDNRGDRRDDRSWDEISRFSSQCNAISFAREQGFVVNEHNLYLSSIGDIQVFYEDILLNRYTLKYDIDGVVIKLNDRGAQRTLGSTTSAPRWAIAYKFPSASAWTRLNDISLQVSRHGVITPVACLEPINIGGVTVSKATLHNAAEIYRKDIRIGDMLSIHRAGDVIPKITGVNCAIRTKEEKRFVFPDKCPSCGSLLINSGNNDCGKNDYGRNDYESDDYGNNDSRNDADCDYNSNNTRSGARSGDDCNVYDVDEEVHCSEIFKICPNGRRCPEQDIQSIVHFCSKKGMDIDGLGEAQIRMLYHNDFIKNEIDIFTIEKREFRSYHGKNLADMAGWGKKSVKNLAKAISNARRTSLPQFIYALGIQHVGLSTARIIANEVIDIDGLLKFAGNGVYDGVSSDANIIVGIGPVTMFAIQSYFSRGGKDLVSQLMMHIEIDGDSNKKRADDLHKKMGDIFHKRVVSMFTGKTLVITGALEEYTREDIKSIFRGAGANVVDSISKKTDFLLYGMNPGGKKSDAERRNIPTIDISTIFKFDA